MTEFEGKVAVITGAASGLGRGLAERCLQEGMRIVLADIEEKALKQTEDELRQKGADILSVRTDVSKANDVERLAEKTLSAFGAVHLLCNNAGVVAYTFTDIEKQWEKNVWDSPLADWEWLMGVNLWGVIHGVRTFVPIMLDQDTECHIVNTGSILGLVSEPDLGIYQTTKHGVVTLTETLYHQLAAQSDKVGVSLLCPGAVNSRIVDAARNHPDEQRSKAMLKEISPEEEKARETLYQIYQDGMPPIEVADHVFRAIQENRFYILTHPGIKRGVQARMENIIKEKNPGQ